MKKSYLTWNKDAVDDEKIYEDLEILSKGAIQRTDLGLAETKDLLQNKPRKKQNNQNNQNNRNQKKHRR
jgi:hypothetical protein